MKRYLRKPRGGATDQITIGVILVASAMALNLSACAPNQSSRQQQALLIGKLEAAKEIDFQNVRDGNSDKVQANDSIYQATKAQKVIEQLQQGQQVPQPEIDDALDVPPESLSRDSREEMIKELLTAEEYDELGEQTHDPGNDWLAWDSYREQSHRAGEISKALKVGVDVPWSQIQEALRVPDFR
jgi:hypothetical protein